MTLLIRFLVPITLLFVNNLFASELIVDLPQLASTLHYKQPARLHQVLYDAKQQLRLNHTKTTYTYWLASQLNEPSRHEEVLLHKTQLLEKLYFLAIHSPEKQIKIDILSSFLTENSFSFRYFLSLDDDLVRISPELNPMLTDKYQLLFSPRINRVQIVGSFVNDKVTFIQNGTLDDYLRATKMPAYSEQDLIYVIQPDGALFEINNAYWSRQPIYLAPGSIIFSGIEDLPEGFSQLNRQIAELLRFKAPLSMEKSY